MTIMILADKHDSHAHHVQSSIVSHGHQALIWDTVDFPSSDCISFFPSKNDGLFRFKESSIEIKFSEISCVYWRNYNDPGQFNKFALSDYHQSKVAIADSKGLVETCFESIKCPWYNGYQGYKLHFRKPETLAIASKLGLKIPDTIVSNDMAEIRKFAMLYPRAIFKPVVGGAHATTLKPEHLASDNEDALRLSPITLQEEILGTNVRVFVFEKKTYACEIVSKTLDFRDDKDIQIVPIEIPSEIINSALEITEALQLRWTGIDFRLDRAGKFYFLEANFSPMFMGFEKSTKQPLTKSLVEMLISNE